MAEWTDENMSKAERLIYDAVEYYEDFMDFKMPDGDSGQRARIGMMLAAVAVAHVIKEFGKFEGFKLTIRSFLAAKKLLKSGWKI